MKIVLYTAAAGLLSMPTCMYTKLDVNDYTRCHYQKFEWTVIMGEIQNGSYRDTGRLTVNLVLSCS